jgi:phosphodiesterase/alkaline phosphatase D-like protein
MSPRDDVPLTHRWSIRPQSLLPESDFLGEEQWAWLGTTLNSSKSDVNIIVSGLQVLPTLRFQGENWDRFPLARKRLLDTIMSAPSLKGPLILSGDVHFAELSTAVCSVKGASHTEPKRVIMRTRDPIFPLRC